MLLLLLLLSFCSSNNDLTIIVIIVDVVLFYYYCLVSEDFFIIIGMEFVGPSKRLYSGQIGGFFWVLGNLIMAGIAYLIRDWSMFQIVCAAPGVLFCFYWL